MRIPRAVRPSTSRRGRTATEGRTAPDGSAADVPTAASAAPSGDSVAPMTQRMLMDHDQLFLAAEADLSVASSQPAEFATPEVDGVTPGSVRLAFPQVDGMQMGMVELRGAPDAELDGTERFARIDAAGPVEQVDVASINGPVTVTLEQPCAGPCTLEVTLRTIAEFDESDLLKTRWVLAISAAPSGA